MTKRKSKIKGKKLSPKQLKYSITKLFNRRDSKRLSAKQVIKKLKIANTKPSVDEALKDLVKNDFLREISGYKYALNKSAKTSSNSEKIETKIQEGKIDMIRSGAAYVIIDGLKDDVYVHAKNMKGAMDGDTVQIRTYIPRGRRKLEGEVVNVIKRATENYIGTLKVTRKFASVHAIHKQNEVEIYVNADQLKGAENGDKVVVKVTKWPKKPSHQPIGEITLVLGAEGSSDIEMKTILINNGFDLVFPKKVMQEANALSTEITEAEIAKRRDMRSVTTFTIDPDTAKDFDDALSIEELENGNYEIGVHIADVSHYVKPNTALDKEAFERSTSVYLVDRVLPMLPEELSNGLCSLRPNEDKCTFSAVFTFDKKDKVIDRWFGKTITHSDRRFTYGEAQERIETKEGDFAQEIEILNRIAHKLRKKKFKDGAIAFESEEVKFRLDENGVPIEVYVKERKDAHMLIEDFMLLANREVATFIAKKGKDKEIPFVYRVHDEPNPDRVADFALFAKEMGIKIEKDNPRALIDSFNNLSKMARRDPALRILEPLAIRTMSKAIYTTENIGHYGLGFEYYSHFTSPIRRYSDVLTHRILEKNLGDTYRTDKEKLEDMCKHISAMERKAMDAERESIKYKQVEFLEKHIGETFMGTINGMIERGLFVELNANKCEGMIGFNEFDESFNMEDSRLKAVGTKTGRVLKMGDPIEVIVLATNLEKRQIELAPVEK